MTDLSQVTTIAQEAFIYGYPIVDMYNILDKYAVDQESPEYKAPLNMIYNMRRLMTPADKAIVAPNQDTLYSYAWLDLGTEPLVVSVPPFAEDRYVSLMLSDLYTYIIGYVSPRTNGNLGGDFLIAGPDWTGEAPAGIKQVFCSPTQLALAFFRTQLFSPADIDNVWAIQDHFRVQPLSQYRKTYLPGPAPDFKWIKPLDVRQEPTSLYFFDILNWMLQYMPVLPEEKALREKFETIGVKPAHIFDVHDEATREALVQGMQAGLQTMQAALGKVRSSGELFGSREFLGSNYVSRAVGAMVGILGNAREEYLGIGYHGESGQFFDGRHAYQIKFGPHDLPPVKAFWSITVYDGSMLLYDNPLHRHVINSPLLDQLVKDGDGGFTLYIQHDSPGADKEPNWLPVPQDKFNLTFRCYQPEQAILNFTYKAPPVVMAA